jgi:hypothetical protein
MIRLMLLDEKGNAIPPEKLETVAELTQVLEQARTLIRECDRLINQKRPKKAGTGVPYA